MNLEQSIINKPSSHYVSSQIDRYIKDFGQFTTLQFSNKVIGSQVKGDLDTISFLCKSHNLDFKPYKIYYIESIKKYFRRDN